MLYKNDERMDLTSPEWVKRFKVLKEEIGKFPVRIKLPETAYTVRKTNPNKKERPRGVIIPFECRVSDEKEGSVKWNYCKTPPVKDPQGNMGYYSNGADAALIVAGMSEVYEKDIDLLYYLKYISPDVEGTPYCVSPSVIFEDTNKEATKRNVKRANMAQVYGALYGHQPMQIEDIIRIAQAFKVPAADVLSEDELKDALFKAVEARESSVEKNGVETFIDLSGNGERLKTLSFIQQAKDAKVLGYEARSGKWYAFTPEGKKASAVCELRSQKTPEESLELAAISNPSCLDVVRDMIKKKEEEMLPA